MKNSERQASLEKNYGLKGDSFYCELCPHCVNKDMIKNGEVLEKDHINCFYNKPNNPDEFPCAKAYNRYQSLLYKIKTNR